MTSEHDLEFRIGHDEIVLRKRYEVLSIGNDILVAMWFIVGSILFFFESTQTIATTLFLLGSVELLIRPVIRLARKVHIQRARSNGQGSGGQGSSGTPADDGYDY
jgi:hypothetical protein